MKKRWRVKSRKSPDPSSPSRSGEAPSPYRSGKPVSLHRSGESYSPHPSGEGDTSAAASDGGDGGDKWEQRMDRAPSSGEDTAVRPNCRRKKVKRRLSDPVRICGDDSLVGEGSTLVPEDQKQKAFDRSVKISPPSNRSNLQEASEVSSAPPPGKKEGKWVVSKTRDKRVWVSRLDLLARPEGSIQGKVTSSALKFEKRLKPSSEDHRKIAQDEDECEHSDKSLGLHASHTSSQFVAHEKGSFDEEEISSRLKAEMNPRPSSEDHRKIAQEEDEDESVHSNKSLSSIVYPSEEQGAGEHIRLLDLDDDTIRERIADHMMRLKHACLKGHYSCDVEEQHVLFERLAFYRIRGYELSMGRNLDKMDDASMAQHYPRNNLSKQGYFVHYEESLEWYFDLEFCEYVKFEEDYQRLVIRNDGNYYDWDSLSSTHNSYEIDLAYVHYCDALEKKIKWIEDYMFHKTIPWEKVENVARLQALKLGAEFPKVSRGLLLSGFTDHIWSIQFDFENYKGLDCLYFEIWKRVTKQKIDFTKALSEIYEENMFPSRTFYIEMDMKDPLRGRTIRDNYDACVACIGDSVSDGEAALMIKEAVKKLRRKPKDYVDYARKKLEIAEEIGLVKAGQVFPTQG